MIGYLLKMKTEKLNVHNSLIDIHHTSLLVLCLIVIFTTSVLAESNKPVDPEMAKQYITEILSQPEFKTTREEYNWRYLGESSGKETPKPPPDPASVSFSFVAVIAQFFEVLLWVLLGVGVILLVIYGSRWLEQWRPQKPVEQDYTATPHLLGKGVKAAFLPTDISLKAWALWQSGDAQAAIGLLYRGALSVLTTRFDMTIDDSATESECLRLVKYKQPVELTTYFSGLTRTWQNIAYAGRLPSDVEAQQLCEKWPQHFG